MQEQVVDAGIVDAGQKTGLETVVLGIAEDLAALRSGKISVKDAEVRAQLAKQYMNGVRLVLNARKSLEQDARPAAAVIGRDAA